MDLNLISKKELLELTGISYGQLYRWKRKNLIPEDWFIRKSTFTGQETFFPKNDILARIDKIKHMKDDLSLDELADVFSPNLTDFTLSRADLLQRNIVSTIAVDAYVQLEGEPQTFLFHQLMYIFVLDRLLQSGEISLEEGRQLIRTLSTHYQAFEGKPCDLIFIRKMGVSTFILAPSANEIFFEHGVKVVLRLSLAGCMEELKAILTESV